MLWLWFNLSIFLLVNISRLAYIISIFGSIFARLVIHNWLDTQRSRRKDWKIIMWTIISCDILLYEKWINYYLVRIIRLLYMDDLDSVTAVSLY